MIKPQRQKILVGNWKMNGLRQDLNLPLEYQNELNRLKESFKNKDIEKKYSEILTIFCPPLTLLSSMKDLYPNMVFGAQNCHENPYGAYTGEISAIMLKDSGADYVIIGHSERQEIETTDQIVKKIKASQDNGLIPIICVGEEKKENETELFSILKKNMKNLLTGIQPELSWILAYEPQWAIGSGIAPSPSEVERYHVYLRHLVEDHFGPEIAQKVPILYGGSLQAENVSSYLSCQNIDGGLVGSSCLSASTFAQMSASVLSIIKEF